MYFIIVITYNCFFVLTEILVQKNFINAWNYPVNHGCQTQGPRAKSGPPNDLAIVRIIERQIAFL